jgi:hypothetical protein
VALFAASIGLVLAGRGYAAPNPTSALINLKNTSGLTARIVFADGTSHGSRIIKDVTLRNGQSTQFRIRYGAFFVSTYKSGASQRDWGMGLTRSPSYNLEVYDGGYSLGGRHVVVLKIRTLR